MAVLSFDGAADCRARAADNSAGETNQLAVVNVAHIARGALVSGNSRVSIANDWGVGRV